jgi:hypothetical protein
MVAMPAIVRAHRGLLKVGVLLPRSACRVADRQSEHHRLGFGFLHFNRQRTHLRRAGAPNALDRGENGPASQPVEFWPPIAVLGVMTRQSDAERSTSPLNAAEGRASNDGCSTAGANGCRLITFLH